MKIEILYQNKILSKHNILYKINNLPQYIVDKHIYFMIKFNPKYDNKFCSYLDEMKPTMYTYRMIRDKLLEDLNKLIRTFEIYLVEYVGKIDCKWVSPDIQQIVPTESMKVKGVSVYNMLLLSFNYTNTYQKLYIEEDNKHFENYIIDYIHGKADINNTIETNNMVLGIDEYLPEDRKNKDIEFIAFKKFYQRIYKQIGCKYKQWVDTIKLVTNSIYNLYIFGHSLDVTDGDVLRDLILNDNVYTTIFYHNKDVMGQQIANLVKVIGQDELIRRTGGSTKTIEFKQQQDMVPR